MKVLLVAIVVMAQRLIRSLLLRSRGGVELLLYRVRHLGYAQIIISV